MAEEEEGGLLSGFFLFLVEVPLSTVEATARRSTLHSRCESKAIKGNVRHNTNQMTGNSRMSNQSIQEKEKKTKKNNKRSLDDTCPTFKGVCVEASELK